MGMSVGAAGKKGGRRKRGVPRYGAMAEINMTPLIDVLLVLLIIFMVITPLTPHGLEALAPQPPPPNAPPPPPGRFLLSTVGLGRISSDAK